MYNDASIWPRKCSNLLMGASAITLAAMSMPQMRERIHDILHIKEENQVAFDALLVGAATVCGLYGIYQRGRRDAANFILGAPQEGVPTWFITEGGTRKNPKYAWRVTPVDVKVVRENV